MNEIDKTVDQMVEQDEPDVDFGPSHWQTVVDALVDLVEVLSGETDRVDFNAARIHVERAIRELLRDNIDNRLYHTWNRIDNQLLKVEAEFEKLRKDLEAGLYDSELRL